MYYEINVSKKGQHYFATAEISITSEKQLEEICKKLKVVFTEEEGFEITARRCENVSEYIKLN
jgi:hypothetical protein